MVIGYIRVSKTEQNQDLQFDALKKAGCEKIYHEKISGASTGYFGEVDHLIPWQIDHLINWRPVVENASRSDSKLVNKSYNYS